MIHAADWVQADLSVRLHSGSHSQVYDGKNGMESPTEIEMEDRRHLHTDSVDYFTILPACPVAQNGVYRFVDRTLVHDSSSNSQGGAAMVLEVAASNMEQTSQGSMRESSADELGEEASIAVQAADPPATVAFADPLDDRDALRKETTETIERIRCVQKNLLQQCIVTTEASVALHREHYKTDIAEPSTLAVALMQRARVAERDYNGAEAEAFTEAAEIAAVRALGGGSQLAISIMLEVRTIILRIKWLFVALSMLICDRFVDSFVLRYYLLLLFDRAYDCTSSIASKMPRTSAISTIGHNRSTSTSCSFPSQTSIWQINSPRSALSTCRYAQSRSSINATKRLASQLRRNWRQKERRAGR